MATGDTINKSAGKQRLGGWVDDQSKNYLAAKHAGLTRRRGMGYSRACVEVGDHQNSWGYVKQIRAGQEKVDAS
jgi:hypothetical protein